MNIIQDIADKFRELYATNGSTYTAPGRINLIGEHTDYNGGYVFPAAIDKGIYATINLNGTSKVRVYAYDLDDATEFSLSESDLPRSGWAKYVFGVCQEIIKRGYNIGGFDAVFSGDIPLGAGMSSSAALESVFAYAINDLFNLGIEPFELARIGQDTEHNYVGVKCGIMDQFASIFGKEEHLIRLDCKSMEYKYYPFNPVGYKLVLIDTVVKHELASSAYNDRRKSCESVVQYLAKEYQGIKFLRDVTLDMLDACKSHLSKEDYMRARYVVEENSRVEQVSDALMRGDYELVGNKMYETHDGMSRLYEVSCEELDFLNKIAQRSGVTGSRVMGGGFGGCTLNLVKEELYDSFISQATTLYKEKFSREPKVYDVITSDGARKL